jgi:hypothetical protein
LAAISAFLDNFQKSSAPSTTGTVNQLVEGALTAGVKRVLPSSNPLSRFTTDPKQKRYPGSDAPQDNVLNG